MNQYWRFLNEKDPILSHLDQLWPSCHLRLSPVGIDFLSIKWYLMYYLWVYWPKCHFITIWVSQYLSGFINLSLWNGVEQLIIGHRRRQLRRSCWEYQNWWWGCRIDYKMVPSLVGWIISWRNPGKLQTTLPSLTHFLPYISVLKCWWLQSSSWNQNSHSKLSKVRQTSRTRCSSEIKSQWPSRPWFPGD